MEKFYYRLLIDSPTGKRLSEFWHSCITAERQADGYAKKMGGQYYYSDPHFFAGGVSFISFPNNKPKDPAMWREVGTQHADGSFDDARTPGYIRTAAADDIVYFEPNVSKRIDWVEVPSRDYRPQDSFDCIHSKGAPMVKTDDEGREHYFVQFCRFEYNEGPGHSGNGLRTASRTVRRAIRAEVLRTKLPAIRVEPLLNLLGADWMKTAGSDGRIKAPDTTPTFFAYEHHYFIGIDYPCSAEGLRDITSQQYRTASDLYRRQMDRKED